MKPYPNVLGSNRITIQDWQVALVFVVLWISKFVDPGKEYFFFTVYVYGDNRGRI